MIFRSVTSRLVFSYCLLLVMLGGAFLAFTVLSFEHYAQETLASNLYARADEIWNLTQGSLDQPVRLAEAVERRFLPEAQDRFIRIRAGGAIIYQSGNPAGRDFAPDDVPLVPSNSQAKLMGNLLLLSRNFSDANGRTITIDNGQSYQFARAVQDRLATSLLVALPVLLLLSALAGVV